MIIFRLSGPCLGLAILAVCAVTSAARSEVNCSEPQLRVEDLKSWARTAALADRAAPHSALRSSRVGAASSAHTRDLTGPASATADAEAEWQPGFGLPILHEYAGAAIEYDGELVVSGWLHSAGPHPVLGIARWTSSGWQPLGEGIVPGFALVVLDNRLYAGSWIGTVSEWDGQNWIPLPPSPLDRLNALFVHGNALIAAGTNGTLGRVASFEGGQWTILGADFDDQVRALGSYRGQLVAGGSFKHAGASATGYVALWNGSSWAALGSGVDPEEYGGVSAIAEYGGRLIVGGWFPGCEGRSAPGLAAWNGRSWAALQNAPPAYVDDLHVMSGTLYVAGRFAGDYSSVASWNGSTWSSRSLGQWTLGLASYRGRLVAVGGFNAAGCPPSRPVVGVAVLGNSGWEGFERWENSMHGFACNIGAGDVRSATIYRGQLVVAGMITLAGSPPGWKSFSGLARWSGSGWEPVGEGIFHPWIVATIGDDLIAAGQLYGTSRGGLPLEGAARWDGAEWHPMGQGLSGFVWALAGYRGRIYAGGEFVVRATGRATTLAVWDGREWSEVQGAPHAARYNAPRVRALEVKDDLLYVGGNFAGSRDVTSPGVLAWNGERWTAVGSGIEGEVETLETFRGELFAGGWLSPIVGGGIQGLLRLDGSTWHPMGLEGTQVKSLGTYEGRLVISGNSGVDRFAPGSIGIVSWDGENWGGFGSGIRGAANALCQMGDDLIAGGQFSRAGNVSSFSIARWSRTPQDFQEDDPLVPVATSVLELRSVLLSEDRAQLSWVLPAPGRVRLDLYDVTGSHVATLFEGHSPQGPSQVEWPSGSTAAYPRSGVYFLRLTSEHGTARAKLVIAR